VYSQSEIKVFKGNAVLSSPRLYTFTRLWFRFIVFNATFNNISVISWRSV